MVTNFVSMCMCACVCVLGGRKRGREENTQVEDTKRTNPYERVSTLTSVRMTHGDSHSSRVSHSFSASLALIRELLSLLPVIIKRVGRQAGWLVVCECVCVCGEQ